MSKDYQNSIIDITDVELSPREPSVCLGNGELEFECCCDECGYYLMCFPEFADGGAYWRFPEEE